MKIYCYFVPKYTFVAEHRVFKVGEEYPVYSRGDYFTLVGENGEFNFTKRGLDLTIKNWKAQVNVQTEAEK